MGRADGLLRGSVASRTARQRDHDTQQSKNAGCMQEQEQKQEQKQTAM
jgi:hypothetical protein